MEITVPLRRLRPMSVEECLDRLAEVQNGHLAGTHLGLPIVVPVQIFASRAGVAFRTLLDAVPPISSGVVALGAGTLADGSPEEWVVEVRGVIEGDPARNAAPDRVRAVDRTVVTGWMFAPDAGDRP